MQFILSRDALHAALSAVGRAVEARNTIPILSNVLLRATSDALELEATDLDISASARIAARITTPGALTVSAAALRAIVAKIAAGAEIAFEQTDAMLAIRSGRARFTLQTLPAEDFPNLEVEPPTHSFALSAKTVAALFAATAFCVSDEETRYYLNGIYLHQIDGDDGPQLALVATDGHRLAVTSVTMPAGGAGMPGVIVPRKAIGEIQRLCEKADGEIAIGVSERKMIVNFANEIRLVTKLIDGTFPEYRRIMPANEIVCEASRLELAVAVDRVASIASARGHAVKLEFTGEGIALSVTNPDAGASADQVEATFAAEPLTIGFNAAYLISILEALGGDKVRIELANPGAAAMLRAHAGAATSYVLMPLRV